jgi:phosphoenolpyruvate carboxylase
METDPHKPLRQDVRLLGQLLGETLRENEGAHLLDTVEHVRTMAKTSRARDDRDFGALAAELERLPVDAAIPLARAFTHFLNLANVAEQHHRVRRRRAYLRDPGSAPQRGSSKEAFARLVARGISPDALFDGVRALQIELVLTAHPTEVSRRTLIHKHNRVAALLAERDRTDLTEPERADLHAALRREILSAWTTDEVRHQRPTPLDEVKSGLIVFEQSLWDALPRFLRSVDRALTGVTGKALPLDAAPVRFRFVDWRRSGRKPERDSRCHQARGAARQVGSGRSLSERGGSAARRAVDDAGVDRAEGASGRCARALPRAASAGAHAGWSIRAHGSRRL